MDKVRLGIVGIGNMGGNHMRYLMRNEVPNVELKAVCDIDGSKLEAARANYGEKLKYYENMDEMFKSGEIDGVLVAIPHYDHPGTVMKVLDSNLHVLCEKPAGVYTKQVREMNEHASKCSKVFGLMFNQRTNPLYQKLRDLIKSGELGELKRTNWIITNWYRSQSYYNSGGWRATWSGEGGGVLLNQDPHQLDLWQWTCGMPKRVRAFMSFGKYHDIEVEDEVTAYVEYENGATGVFVTTTGEAPGTNRFEVAGDRGKIVIEDDKLTFWRLRVSERQFNREYKGGFGAPECWECNIPIVGENPQHKGIMKNWAEAILKGTPLMAPGQEGINGLQISNAMHLSAWTDSWIDIPVDEDLYYRMLQDRIKNSTFVKYSENKTLDTKGTY